MVDASRREIYEMDGDGRNVRLVADKVPAGVWSWPSPDGKHLAYAEGQDLKLWSLEASAFLVTLAQFPKGKPLEAPAWSPMAARSHGGRMAGSSALAIRAFNADPDGSNRWRGDRQWGASRRIAWSPDGQSVACVIRDVSSDSKSRSGLWIVPASGGAPRKVADAPASHPRLGDIAWHPGGRMVLASVGPEETQPRTYEHWTMQGFLPRSRAGK